jgi:predicted amino acid racemase
MAFIVLDKTKLKENYQYLDNIFETNDIQWSVVTKMLCGNTDYVTELLNLGVKQVCDSRLSNLKIIKDVNPNVETIFIKPPSRSSVKTVVKYADISMNSTFDTIKLLSKEAQRQKKIHKIIIMIELGELREGIMGDDLMSFYKSVFELKNIEVVGLGTNFSCLYGVLPHPDKLIQLSLYEQLIEAKFDRQIPYLSGGSSVVIPLVTQGVLPKAINHFRVGETLFLGTDVYNNVPFEEMHQDVFTLYSEIIELIEKPVIPSGEMGQNVEGHSFEFDQDLLGTTTYRAILDMGLLDVGDEHLELIDKSTSFVGASSDMFVVDLGENKAKLKVGDKIEIKMDYMGVLRVINSRYIDKRVK